MKRYSFLLLAALVAVVAAALSEECQYVYQNIFLTDAVKVKKCFNSYNLSQDVIDAILENLELVGEIYPYVDIASNPPADPPGYFKVMNYDSDLEMLRKNLNESDGVISKVVRPVQAFVKGFRDGHFSLSITEGPLSSNIFAHVVGVLPFEVILEDNGEKRVFISLNEHTEVFLPMKSYDIYSKYMKRIYVATVDGKDAFTFFMEFFGEYNEMKSKQGRLMRSISSLKEVFSLLSYPIDNAFDKFTLTYSDGSSLKFGLGFLNCAAQYSTRDGDSKIAMPKPKHFINYVSRQRELEILHFLEHFDERKRPTKRELVSDDIQCGMIGDMNYLSLPTFGPDDEKSFVFNLFDCMEDFDNNDKPITIILKNNGGGSDSLEKLTQFLLMPESDVRSLEAFRKTMVNEQISRRLASYFSNISNNCESLSSEEVEQFLSQEDKDDLGNGVVHTRSKKMFVSSKDLLRRFERFSLKKNARKPTDIIVATDGYCFSACSEFVDNCITSGSAIVTGFGVSSPGDDKFVAGQCPSLVLKLNDVFSELGKKYMQYGISVRTTFTESYIISEDMKEKIPLDYSILRVDKHCGYNNSFDPDLSELLKHTTAVHEEFKTNCNPDNQRLLLVDDKCHVDDPNALHSGYACGADGKWDTAQCKISSCKTGYIVDFKTNKCIPNCCDPRIPKYPPSSSSSSVSESVEAASNMHPMIAFCLASLFILMCLAFSN